MNRKQEGEDIHTSWSLEVKKKTFSIDTCTFAYCHALLLFEEESEEENERRRARIKIKLRVLFQLSICPWPTLHARRERLGTRPCSISVPPKKVGNISKRWEYFKKWGKFNQSPWTLIGLHYWSMEKMENDKKIKGTLTSALYSSPNGTARSGM